MAWRSVSYPRLLLTGTREHARLPGSPEHIAGLHGRLGDAVPPPIDLRPVLAGLLRAEWATLALT